MVKNKIKIKSKNFIRKKYPPIKLTWKKALRAVICIYIGMCLANVITGITTTNFAWLNFVLTFAIGFTIFHRSYSWFPPIAFGVSILTVFSTLICILFKNIERIGGKEKCAECMIQ